MFPRSIWGKTIFWILFAVALLAGTYGLFRYPETPTFKRSALVAHAGATPGKPVEVTARVSGNYVETGGLLDLIVDVTNAGKSPLKEPKLSVTAPRLASTEPGPCVNLSDGTSKVTELQPDETCRFSVKMTAKGSAGLDGITTVVSWNAGLRNTSLSLGPIRFESGLGEDKWARFGRRLTQISLPVILVLVASLFTQMQKKREEEQEVRQAILTRLLKLSDKCYMPIVTETSVILAGIEDLRAVPPKSSAEYIFFHMVMLLRKMDELRVRGGIFFKQRSGEAVASACWNVLRRTIYGVLTDDGAKLAKDKLETAANQNLPYFKGQITGDPALQAIFVRFQSWIAGTDPVIKADYGEMKDYEGVIDVIRGTFLYEANLPLSEHWYKEDSPFRLRPERGTTVSLPTHPGLNETQMRAIATLKELLPAYAKKNGKLKLTIT
jgi:hypothetical protein